MDIFVSTKLNIRHFDKLLSPPCDDIGWYGELHRKLDPFYYAWLTERYTQARRSHLDGIIPNMAIKWLRLRFGGRHHWIGRD